MSRRIIAIAAGTAVFAGLNLISAIPGLELIRPGIAAPLLAGALFGPLVGFGVGVLGSSASDLVTDGFYWNWSLGDGIVGAVAGASPLIANRFRRRWISIGSAVVLGVIAIIAGAAAVSLTEISIANLDVDDALGAEGQPLAMWNLIWGVPLLVVGLVTWMAAPKLRRRAASPPGAS